MHRITLKNFEERISTRILERGFEYYKNDPYDMGAYCKHEVAVFNFLKYSEEAKKSSSNKMHRVRNILDTFTKEDLKEQLLFILKNNREARKDFLEENE